MTSKKASSLRQNPIMGSAAKLLVANNLDSID